MPIRQICTVSHLYCSNIANMVTVFNAIEVFGCLYKEICYQVCRTGVLAHEGSIHMILPSGFIKLLEDEFVRQVNAYSRIPHVCSSMWHRQNVLAAKRDWLTLRSINTCFMCMRARPLYRVPCGHYLCDTCVRRHGVRTDMWIYTVPQCFLCELDTAGVTIKLKPPTATSRLLSIDGGGVRAIYTLIVLQALQELVGLPFPVYGNFDYVFGTSAGKSIVVIAGKADTNFIQGGLLLWPFAKDFRWKTVSQSMNE